MNAISYMLAIFYFMWYQHRVTDDYLFQSDFEHIQIRVLVFNLTSSSSGCCGPAGTCPPLNSLCGNCIEPASTPGEGELSVPRFLLSLFSSHQPSLSVFSAPFSVQQKQVQELLVLKCIDDAIIFCQLEVLVALHVQRPVMFVYWIRNFL